MIPINRCLFAKSFRPTTSAFSFKFAGYTSRAASSLHQVCDQTCHSEDEMGDYDWDNLGFGLVPTDYMYVMKCSKDKKFEQGKLSRYGNIELSPCAGVLNYGQAIFEGIKAYRKDDGRLLLFRPDQNAMRMMIGAERMCMQSPSVDQFIEAVKQTTLANKRWVPPRGKGSLYVRPLLLGSGPSLGVSPAPDYSFVVFGSPVKNYFKDGTGPLNLYVEEEFIRASRGGTGAVKTIANYGPVLEPLRRARERGYSDVLYLDAEKKKYLEEVSASNIFLVKGDAISTPATSGTILSGITRKSVIDLARDFGYKVEERAVSVDELDDADEVFCTGTAVGVASVGSITYRNRRIEFSSGPRSVARELYSTLSGIQSGIIEDKKGWVLEVN